MQKKLGKRKLTLYLNFSNVFYGEFFLSYKRIEGSEFKYLVSANFIRVMDPAFRFSCWIESNS
jgi:hypothetical protein